MTITIQSFFAKKGIPFLMALLLLNIPVFSQNAFNIDSEGKIINADLKQVLQKRGYDAISAFDTISYAPSMVCAIYVKNKQIGIVDNTGKEITKAQYNGFLGIENSKKIAFDKGYLIGYKGKKFGVIDYLGNEKIPFIYDYIMPLNKWERKEFNTDDKHLFTARESYKEYIINERNEIIKQSFSGGSIGNSSPQSSNKNNRFGYHVEHLHNLKMEVIAKENGHNTLKGIYNPQTDKLVVEQQYSALKQGIGEQIIAQKEGKWGVIDVNKNILLAFEYSRISSIAEGYKVNKDEKVAYFSADFKSATDFIYDAFMRKSTSNMKFLTLSKNKKLGVLNANAEEITEFIYDDISFEEICYPKDKDNQKRSWIIIATLNGKKGLLDDEGNKLLSCNYDDFDFYSCDRNIDNIPTFSFSFKKDGKYGFYNKNFELVLKDFDKIKWNNQGKNSFYAYKKNGTTNEWYVYSLTSNKLDTLPNEFFFDGNKVGGYYSFESNLVSLYFTKKEGKYGINAKHGNPIIPASIEINNITACTAKEIYKGLVRVVFEVKANSYPPINIHDYYIDYNANYTRID